MVAGGKATDANACFRVHQLGPNPPSTTNSSRLARFNWAEPPVAIMTSKIISYIVPSNWYIEIRFHHVLQCPTVLVGKYPLAL